MKLVENPRSPYLIVGARSSLLLPFQNLGFVIVDEEHETSFKQFDPAPRYHARDTAILLATLFKARVLLGSATPSVESYTQCPDRKVRLYQPAEALCRSASARNRMCGSERSTQEKETARSL
ncbi:MAG: hypothetical protein U5L96_10425 [Owenweeksia sp.]|nr:hypothetical protein [Owenweeksia sp.]